MADVERCSNLSGQARRTIALGLPALRRFFVAAMLSVSFVLPVLTGCSGGGDGTEEPVGGAPSPVPPSPGTPPPPTDQPPLPPADPLPPAPGDPTPSPPSAGSYPILFVTQVPIQADFSTIASTFGNHSADLDRVGRGGDLWIRYPDGQLKNLTAAAGLGMSGEQQGDGAIAVRDPSVHWSGQKALFSMARGAPSRQHEQRVYVWQIYEITGLGPQDSPVVARVAQQPADYNNLTPLYGTDDRIIFTSDRPRGGERHLYPQLDEYESAATNTGLWSMDPNVAGGDLKLLNHAPSGNFTPILDSFGRIVFTQWDHLMRDQQAGDPSFGTFNYASERADAARLASNAEVFPETRDGDEAQRQGIQRHVFNHFFPWTVLEDGSGGETLSHLGRHELHTFFEASLLGDPNLRAFVGNATRPVFNLFQIREDPLRPGRYIGVDAPEFQTHGSGQIVGLQARLGDTASSLSVEFITHEQTKRPIDAPSVNHSGFYRDPLPLSDGALIAAHTPQSRAEDPRAPQSIYDFRLKRLRVGANGSWAAAEALTPGISKSVSYWSPGVRIRYDGPLWELQPVEVRERTRPARLHAQIEPPESRLIDETGIDLARLRTFLETNKLAIAVTRNVSSRDAGDRQQPFNLRVPGGVQTVGSPGRIYDVSHLQFFQADLLRGLGGTTSPRAGRRVLAQPMHDPAALAANPANPGGPPGSVRVASDGSAAAFVPAERALSWQLTDEAGSAVVRERYWVTYRPGEVRVCASCHGLNDRDQAGRSVPSQPPEALRALLRHWQQRQP